MTRLSISSYFGVILEFKHNMSLLIAMSSMMTTSSSSNFKLDNQSKKKWGPILRQSSIILGTCKGYIYIYILWPTKLGNVGSSLSCVRQPFERPTTHSLSLVGQGNNHEPLDVSKMVELGSVFFRFDF
jgi:hypothetical protein